MERSSRWMERIGCGGSFSSSSKRHPRRRLGIAARSSRSRLPHELSSPPPKIIIAPHTHKQPNSVDPLLQVVLNRLLARSLEREGIVSTHVDAHDEGDSPLTGAPPLGPRERTTRRMAPDVIGDCIRRGGEGLEALLASSSVKALDAPNAHEQCPLHVAVHASDVRAVELLLAAGANPDPRDGESGW